MIKVYSYANCPYCTELKTLMTNDGLEFIDVDVSLEENKAEFDEIVRFTHCSDLPIVRVNHMLLIPEASFKSIPEALYATKKFLT